jgi:hypothetical protein
MSDLLRRARDMKSLVGRGEIPPPERLQQALSGLSGLQIGAIDKAVWERFEGSLVAVNAILDRYALETFEDYKTIGEDDARQALEILQSAAEAAIEAELDRIIAELDKGVDKLPVAAIQEAREHRDLIVPRLIRAIRDATASVRAGDRVEGNAHFLALFLLSEFQAAEALPAIVEAISLPGMGPEDLFDDVVTEVLARVLAQFAGDAAELLDPLIDSRDVNQFVRWEASQAYPLLVRDGRLSAAAAASRLKHHLRRAIDREDCVMLAPLIHELTILDPSDAIDEITEAFDRNLVETFMIGKRDVDAALARGEAGQQERLAELPATGIVDTIAELRTWAAFSEKPAKPPAPIQSPPLAPMPRIPKPHAFETTAPTAAPVISHHGHTGRNDPCPCGSGKKFKKCCLSRG